MYVLLLFNYPKAERYEQLDSWVEWIYNWDQLRVLRINLFTIISHSKDYRAFFGLQWYLNLIKAQKKNIDISIKYEYPKNKALLFNYI